MIDLIGTNVIVEVGGIETNGVVIGQDAETQHYVIRYTTDNGTSTVMASLSVVAPPVAPAATGATQMLTQPAQPAPLRVWLASLASFVRGQPVAAAAVAFVLTGLLSLTVVTSAPVQPAQLTPTVDVPTPVLVANKTYARMLTEQREAYAAPNGEFLGAVEAGRGYALLHDDVAGWTYVDLDGAGPVWLIDLPAAPVAPEAVVVEAPQPVAPPADSIAQARPVQIVEYVPPVVMTPVPVVADVTTKHAGPPKPEMERKQPEKSLMTP